MELNVSDLRVGYVVAVRRVVNHGARIGPRGLMTRELTNVTLTCPPNVPMLPVGVGRGVSLKLAAVEALQLIAGVSRHDLVLRAVPGFADVLVNPENASYGAYGPRVADQVPNVIRLLRDDPDTRRAVISIWREEDLTHDGDRPCTIFFQFLIRNGALELHSRMRSQDALLGLAYDAWAGCQLRDTIAWQLNVPAGGWFHTVTSFHVYERDLRLVKKLHLPSLDDQPILPRGVRTHHRRHSPAWAAEQLLTGDADATTTLINPWYVEQLARLNVHQRKEVTT